MQISVTANVTGGQCRASFNSTANAGNWINFDDAELMLNSGGGGPDVQTGWDPTDPNSGNGWENQALFDYNFRALPAISVFSEF